MVNPYRTTRRRLQADILAWVEAGTPLTAIAAQPDMPSDNTVRKWRRADPSFDQLMATALKRGQHRRLWRSDDPAMHVFLDRYRAGETLEALFADPALPGRNAFQRWLHAAPAFAEEIHRLKRVHAHVRRQAVQGRNAIRPFDPAIADRLLYRVGQGFHMKRLHETDPAMPRLRTIARWRRENPAFDADLALHLKVGRGRRRHVAARRAAALADQILTRVAAGATYAGLARVPGMPSVKTLGRWLRADPAFAREMRRARMYRAEGRMGERERRG